MATAEQPLAGLRRPHAGPPSDLADQWRRLTRAATAVALLTSPALIVWFKRNPYEREARRAVELTR